MASLRCFGRRACLLRPRLSRAGPVAPSWARGVPGQLPATPSRPAGRSGGRSPAAHAQPPSDRRSPPAPPATTDTHDGSDNDGTTPPTLRNQRRPRPCDTPTARAASSVSLPARTSAQNRRCTPTETAGRPPPPTTPHPFTELRCCVDPLKPSMRCLHLSDAPPRSWSDRTFASPILPPHGAFACHDPPDTVTDRSIRAEAEAHPAAVESVLQRLTTAPAISRMCRAKSGHRSRRP